MNLVALDLSQKVGWAARHYMPNLVQGGGAFVRSSGVKNISVGRGTNPDVRFLIFEKWLDDLCLLKRPNAVAYEKPFMRGGAASDFLGMLVNIVRMYCIRKGITYMAVTPRELKKFATGDGNADKKQMVLTAEERYGKVQDDNQADALHVLAWAKEKLNVGTSSIGNTGVSKKASI